MNKLLQLATQCREKLLESDISIFDFYLHGNNFKAAQKRLDIISKEHIPQLPIHQPKALELSIQLAQAQNNTESILRTQLELGQKFPEHEITKRLVTDLPGIKTQLASLEQKALMPIELPAINNVQLTQNSNTPSDFVSREHINASERDRKEQLKQNIQVEVTDDAGKTRQVSIPTIPAIS